MYTIMNDIISIKSYLITLQKKICIALSNTDDGYPNIQTSHHKFQADTWKNDTSGSFTGEGMTCVLEQGNIFEKAAVNFSYVAGEKLPPAATQRNAEIAGRTFQALGVSLILHPSNPFIPTTHFNIRFFIAEKENEAPIWWFGGGYDLTPYYGFEEDARHWHITAKTACDPFGEEVYPTFKKQCDEYFFLKHRQEPRGIGGIFFDDLNAWGFKKTFEFMRSVGDSFLPAYLPIVEKRKTHSYTQSEKEFQLYRRGRYVEFNLAYDRGTQFGMQFGGRAESFLCSLPPVVHWKYNWRPAPNTPEAQLYEKFLIVRDWV